MPPLTVSAPLPSDLKLANLNLNFDGPQQPQQSNNPLMSDFMNLSLASSTASTESKSQLISTSLANPIANPTMTYSSLHSAPPMPSTASLLGNLNSPPYSQADQTKITSPSSISTKLTTQPTLFPLPMKTSNINFPTPTESNEPYYGSGFVSSYNQPPTSTQLSQSTSSNVYNNYSNIPLYPSTVPPPPVTSIQQQSTNPSSSSPLTTINLNQPIDIDQLGKAL